MRSDAFVCCAEGITMTSNPLSNQLTHFLSFFYELDVGGSYQLPDVSDGEFFDAIDNIVTGLEGVGAETWDSYVQGSGILRGDDEDAPALPGIFLGGFVFQTGSDAAETLPFGDESFTVDAGNGANSINGGSGNNFVKTGIGADTINLTSGNNFIISEAGANVIKVTSGHNFISTGLGADSITATGGNNVIDAGDGANTITVTDGDNIIITGNGADNITTAGIATTYAGNGTILKQGTINTISAGDGANTITTGAGDDHITGGINADTITSGAGNDTVFAGNGANTITTGDGDDVIHTGVDVDTVAAGLGDDRIHVYGGTDTIAAGAGNDTLIVHFEGALGAVSINSLSGNFDIGYSGNVSGFGAATFLGVENFHISSGGADDIITTGDGADIIYAGGGDDEMTGGKGSDIFVFKMTDVEGSLKNISGADRITDFNADEDKLYTGDIEYNVITSSDDDYQDDALTLRDGYGNTITLEGFSGVIGDVVFITGVDFVEYDFFS
jgi:Ca2+-binding RTX toxin-like protein